MFAVLHTDLQPPFALTIARNGSHTIVSLRGELDIAAEGDMIICMGAGDITKWAAGLADGISKARKKK